MTSGAPPDVQTFGSGAALVQGPFLRALVWLALRGVQSVERVDGPLSARTITDLKLLAAEAKQVPMTSTRHLDVEQEPISAESFSEGTAMLSLKEAGEVLDRSARTVLRLLPSIGSYRMSAGGAWEVEAGAVHAYAALRAQEGK